MDEDRMSALFHGLPPWATLLALAAHLLGGIGLGLLYFQGLWWNARLFGEGGRVTTAVVLTIGRFVLLGGLLALTSLEGPLPLLVTSFGVLLARFGVMRRVRGIAP
jgi:F1F0 ATPase subunit 2